MLSTRARCMAKRCKPLSGNTQSMTGRLCNEHDAALEFQLAEHAIRQASARKRKEPGMLSAQGLCSGSMRLVVLPHSGPDCSKPKSSSRPQHYPAPGQAGCKISRR